MSTDKIWFISQGEDQMGPFTKEELFQQIVEKAYDDSIFLFCTGWKDWMPVAEALKQVNLPLAIEGGKIKLQERRTQGARVEIHGQIIVHNQGDLLIGSGVNLSAAGLFVETDKSLFKVGEVLQLTCKLVDMAHPFQAKAEVVRFNSNHEFPVGFGMRWKEIPGEVVAEIQQLVAKAKANKGTSGK
jgi:Tfp pilus assembly protein PilZ